MDGIGNVFELKTVLEVKDNKGQKKIDHTSENLPGYGSRITEGLREIKELRKSVLEGRCVHDIAINTKSGQGWNPIVNKKRTQKRDRQAKVKNQKKAENRTDGIEFPKRSRLCQKIDSLEKRIEGNKLLPSKENPVVLKHKRDPTKVVQLPIEVFQSSDRRTDISQIMPEQNIFSDDESVYTGTKGSGTKDCRFF